MSKKYLFPCSCGRSQAIEVSQAGQMIACPCGLERQAPTMLKIKDLQPAPEEKTARQETGVLRQAFFYIGLILLIPSLIFLIWSLRSYPQPRDVSNKQVMYTYGQTTVYQNSNPIPDFEHRVLWMQDEHFNMMAPMEVFYYFLWLKQGPEFSYNFLETYQSLKDAYYIRVTASSIFVALALLSLAASAFMPKQNVIVTGWSGTDWK